MDSIIKDTWRPLTIPEWRAAQESGDGLSRLLALREFEAKLNSNAWITLASPAQIEQQWAYAESLRSSSAALPLFGVPFAAKDNIDVASFPTTAACLNFSNGPVGKDATVITRLKAAGAIVLGKTNLDQFATGLVGTRSPHGPVGNSFDPTKVSGGSSSGSAVVVARGVVPFSLGTDTAGSGRVPAGLNNIVGLKPTRGALSTTGVLPACRSLDCVSIFALTVEDAETVLSAVEGFDPQDSFSRTRLDTLGASTGRRFAICDNPPWFGKTEQAAAYAKALAQAKSLGWILEPRNFSALFKLANLLYEGPWVAERYAAIKDFLEAHEDDMDPTVREIILKAKKFDAVDLFEAEYLRQDLTREIQENFDGFDAILVPTAPTFPALEDIAKEPIKENANLGTYTNFVNFMDWSAISVPAGFRSDGLPFGITLISSTWEEPKLLAFAREWLSHTPCTLGATKIEKVDNRRSGAVAVGAPETTRLVVVGAHLTGFPLNKDLTSRGATLETATTTSPSYKFYSLKTGGKVRKPGLKRVPSGGSAIRVEVWNLPTAEMASFMKTVASPLAIGSLELLDGSWAPGFVCEPYGLDDATEITSFRGWRAFIQSLSSDPQINVAKPDYISLQTDGINSVLIANRGEIATRIIRTLHHLGLKAITIHSSSDSRSPHVRNADISLPLKGTSVSETYLNGPQIISLAKSAGVDAIIPGYGFLAENADFASAVEAEGMIWVGPTPEQMRRLGLKHLARDAAMQACVPVVPGSKHLLKSAQDALDEADRIRYPVMLKSTAGGGGIGLKRCDDSSSLLESFESVQRLAQANFGDAGVFVEHFIERARHIEVQIIGDGKGNVTAAGERDCSLQRRNQKVIEESPAAFVPADVRTRMRKAAVDLASAVQYRNVGTIEFIYDVDATEFYFLEVNTRLQVEHPVTEAVTRLDLVECMLRVASGHSEDIFTNGPAGFEVKGNSIEARVYAESPLQNFRPSPGLLLDVSFPDGVRVDTWVEAGMEMSSSYDPLIAKIIATGENRAEAISKLATALDSTVITGVETNLEYLRRIVDSAMFNRGNFTTTSLNSFRFVAKLIEVVDSGALTTVQDYPGRKGLWHIGVPQSGPIDDYSFRLANRLVGNDPSAAGLECTAQGPSLLFHFDTIIAVTGAPAEVTVGNKTVSQNTAIIVAAGQTLTVGTPTAGYRSYIAVQGGIDVPKIFNSRSTFALGKIGGHNGRNLCPGDLVSTGSLTSTEASEVPGPAIPLPSKSNCVWILGVVPGQHSAPEHFTEEGLDTLFSGEWVVHHNSNRVGIRLNGPKPQWSRKSGGEAGLHPSNIHDSAYSIGSISFTGDEAVILACDGPSLGGFVVFCVVASAEMWKLGQLRPGDTVKLKPISVNDAIVLETALEYSIAKLEPLKPDNIALPNNPSLADLNPLLGDIGTASRTISVRQAGDHSMLLEFGTDAIFSIQTSFQIFCFIARHRHSPIPGVLNLSPGVRTLHIEYTPGTTPSEILSALRAHENSLGTEIPSSLPSRTIRLPLAFDDSISRAAVARYAATIRATAPWLPSNIDFLQQLNALDSRNDVERIFLDATFLVLGLGDVFLGAPCAVPLDPRHRLFGTKYNPSRSFTPRGSVGIGGQYMCIYGMNSPGGYQLVGRTLPIWDDVLASAASQKSQPWLFRLFDRISFYAISEAELDSAIAQGEMRELIKIEEGSLDLHAYEAWLDRNKEDIETTRAARSEAIRTVPFMEELLQPYRPPDTERRLVEDEEVAGNKVKSQMPGQCWKCEVNVGDDVEIGDALVWIESNKMEIKIASPVKGKVVKMLVAEGDVVRPFDDLLVVASE